MTTIDELRMEMLASVAAVGLVRTLVEQRLVKWDLAGLVSDATLVAAELVTNAVNASPTGAVIRVRLSRDHAGVLLEVWDPAGTMPRPQHPTTVIDTDPDRFDDNGGWGLTIVRALSVDGGVEPSPGGGKTVWSRLKPS